MNMDILISGIKSKFKCLRVRLIRNLDKLKKKGVSRLCYCQTHPKQFLTSKTNKTNKQKKSCNY